MKIEGFDSREEKLFSFYVAELLDKGWLLNAEYQPTSIPIIEDHYVYAYVSKKNTSELQKVKLANKMSFTPDWKLWWDKRAEGVFYWQEGGVYQKGFYPYNKKHAENYVPFYASGGMSLIDVKGSVIGRSNTSAITFPIKQKVLLKDDVFVQKIVVSLDEKGIFHKSFTPRQVIIDEVFKVNCKTGNVGDSKLKFKPTLLEQWTKNRLNRQQHSSTS